jgi:hypothetical protein
MNGAFSCDTNKHQRIPSNPILAMGYSQVVQSNGGKYRRIACHTLSTNFRESTHIVEELFPSTLAPNQVLIENHFLGINASDINFTNGRYGPTAKLPFPCGFECIGQVKAVGSRVRKLKPGDAAVLMKFGSFSEFMIAQEDEVIKIPVLSKYVLPTIVCGATASIALDEVGEMRSGETVLVTAAAGSTGQFAVQLAKLAGNHVIGTCSSQVKVEYLKSLGCDRVINYREEDIAQVLRKEYPKGVDVVFESVGGSVFDAAAKNLAIKGRLIVVGAISGYQNDTAWKKENASKPGMPLSTKLLTKSASVRGFFLNHYHSKSSIHARKLSTLIRKGLMNPGVDPTKFMGLGQVADALDYMYERKNIGKLIVSLLPDSSSRL